MPLQTRSQTRSQLNSSLIDFDEASKAWKANKIKINNGCYRYICVFNHDTICLRKCLNGEIYCKKHYKL
jgi:hypothetical protein